MLEFSERLAMGKTFEEEASRFLTSQGFPIGLHFSAAGQWEWGESAAHCEIKFDRRWKETGNLFIETRERRNADGTSAWRPAGIYDAAAPWFYLIGDRNKLWLLSVALLIRMDFSAKYPRASLPTAEGFLLPVGVADQWAIRLFLDWLPSAALATQRAARLQP